MSNILNEIRLLLCEAKLGGYEIVSKTWKELEVKEITDCIQSGKFNGVSIGRDKDGYFVTTHRARSKSYSMPDKIPQKDIKFIASTG